LKALCIANGMKYLLIYAGLQNESPTQPGPFDRNSFQLDVIIVANPIPSTAVEAQVESASVGGKANHEIETSHLLNTHDLAIKDGMLRI